MHWSEAMSWLREKGFYGAADLAVAAVGAEAWDLVI